MLDFCRIYYSANRIDIVSIIDFYLNKGLKLENSLIGKINLLDEEGNQIFISKSEFESRIDEFNKGFRCQLWMDAKTDIYCHFRTDDVMNDTYIEDYAFNGLNNIEKNRFFTILNERICLIDNSYEIIGVIWDCKDRLSDIIKY